jgi:hypothetical protein
VFLGDRRPLKHDSAPWSYCLAVSETGHQPGTCRPNSRQPTLEPQVQCAAATPGRAHGPTTCCYDEPSQSQTTFRPLQPLQRLLNSKLNKSRILASPLPEGLAGSAWEPSKLPNYVSITPPSNTVVSLTTIPQLPPPSLSLCTCVSREDILGPRQQLCTTAS